MAEEAMRVKNDRGGIGLIAKDDELIRWSGLGENGIGDGLGTQHRFEAGEGNVRSDEEYRGGEVLR